MFKFGTSYVQVCEKSSFPSVLVDLLIPHKVYQDFISYNLHRISDPSEVRVSFYHFRVKLFKVFGCPAAIDAPMSHLEDGEGQKRAKNLSALYA